MSYNYFVTSFLSLFTPDFSAGDSTLIFINSRSQASVACLDFLRDFLKESVTFAIGWVGFSSGFARFCSCFVTTFIIVISTNSLYFLNLSYSEYCLHLCCIAT